MNLIINAAEAIGTKPGTILCRTWMEDVESAEGTEWLVLDQSSVPGRFAVLEIRDDGIGMSRETLKRVFDPYFTTKRNGHGLGLSALIGIIKMHHGGIRVQTEPNKGTAFQIALPVASSQPAAIPVEECAAAGAFSNGSVLVIDDEDAVRDVVIDMLEKHRIQAIAAEDGLAGIRLYEQRRDEIKLILLDISVPGIGAEETFQRLREIDPSVRVVLTSEYFEEKAVEKLVDQGLAGFVHKPYRWNQLMNTIMGYAG
jgi:CheY-like chemotaxis protein